jgi:hypothetical protein
VAYDPTDSNLWNTTVSVPYLSGDGLIHKNSPGGGPDILTIPDPGGLGGSGIGALAYDAEDHALWAAAYLPTSDAKSRLYKLDPATGNVLKTCEIASQSAFLGGAGNDTLAVAHPGDLSGKKVLLTDAADLEKVPLLAIDPTTCAVVKQYTLPVPVAGIAVDGSTGALIASASSNIDNLGTAPYSTVVSSQFTGKETEGISLQPPGPIAAPNPPSIPFGRQVATTDSPAHSLALENSGTSDLHVGTITVAGPNATDFSILSDGCSSTTVHPLAHCTLTVKFTPGATGLRAATLNVPIDGGTRIVPLSGTGVNPADVTAFYFAEGYTGGGFTETLSLLMPNQDGGAAVDYYTANGTHLVKTYALTAGHVTLVAVNQDVGPNQEVSAKVSLPGPGVAERTINFNIAGQWHGSTDIVGVAAPSTEWDFAEGSTLTNGVAGPLIFSEYLTLQNPNASSVPVTLNYFTDSGLTPVKGLTLGANSRTTVEVFHGDTSNVTSCVANGTSASCGVGPGIAGVSVQVKSGTLPIIAERPFYVNGYSLGDGVIRDGHDAFGATAPASTWNFAEGTTLTGFKEYLTLQNPGMAAATVSLNYFTNTGAHPVKTVTVNAHSRVTVEVFRGDATTNQNPCTASGTGANCGVGPGIPGVSIKVTTTVPIVAERPMYMVVDFGTGSVAGAHVAVGATGLGTLFGFAAGSTLAGENDYLTIQNPGPMIASLTITYYTNSGSVQKRFNVSPNSRVTVEVFKGSMMPNSSCSPAFRDCGVGPSVSPLGIVIQAPVPILVEKPTYNSTSAGYGATDTLGYSPSGF